MSNSMMHALPSLTLNDFIHIYLAWRMSHDQAAQARTVAVAFKAIDDGEGTCSCLRDLLA
jgi:hypothetical protein